MSDPFSVATKTVAIIIGILGVLGLALWNTIREQEPNAPAPKPPFAINVKSQSLYGHDYLVFVATSGEVVEGTSVIHSESCTNSIHLR